MTEQEYLAKVRKMLADQTDAHVAGNVRRVVEIRENIRILRLRYRGEL